jgi:hypothetical protein
VTWVTTFTAGQNRELSKLVLDHTAASGPWKLVFQAKDVNLANPSQAPSAAGVVENNTHSALTSGRMRFAADPKQTYSRSLHLPDLEQPADRDRGRQKRQLQPPRQGLDD